MQNAMDIMAMVQKTSMVKQKFDVPSKTLGSEKASFRKQLEQVRKDITKDNDINTKDAVSNSQRTTEKSVEKFAKVMSNNNIKAEVAEKPTEKPSIEALEQTDSTEPISNLAVEDIKQVEQLDEKVTIEETMQTVLEMVQQLIQMLQGQKVEGTPNQQLTDLSTEAHEILLSLEQALKVPITSQNGELNKLLSSLKNDFTELVKQLEIVPEYKLDDKQTKQLVNELSNKLNLAKTQVHQMLQPTEKTKDTDEVSKLLSTLAVKSESKENVTINDSTKIIEEPDENQQIQGTNADTAADSKDTNDNMDNKDSKDNKNRDDFSGTKEAESTYKVSANSELKNTVTVDKLNQDGIIQVVAPQDEKLDFQLNIKQANANLQKESLVKINKSDIINQVITKAEVVVQGSHQEMIMKLEPESLGKLNLKIVVENGLVTAKFLAESQQVKEVLESSFNQLKGALQDKGIAVQSFSVSVGQQGAEFNSGKGFDQWKKSIKLSNKISGDYMQLDDEISVNLNPYSYHEGKVDLRA